MVLGSVKMEARKENEAKKFLTPPSPSKAKKRSWKKRTAVSPVPGKKRATESVRSGNTTPPLPPAADEENLSVSMDEESDSDLSNSDTENTKDPSPLSANASGNPTSGNGNLNNSEDEGFSVVSHKKKVASIVIDASKNTTELLNILSEHIGSTLEGRFENGKLHVFPKTYLSILHKRITKKHTVIPPLHGPSGMAYSDFEKAEAFKDTLEVTFQENTEPYSDDKIEEVESLVNNYFDNFNTHTPPLTSPLELTMKRATPLVSPNPRDKRVCFDKDNGKVSSFKPDAVPGNHFHLGGHNYTVVSDFACVA
ncbi:uncharacterized protein TNCV_1776321 [Trichonephila clavipes]|nr:uncharacterized protein TNCV_1776321 [Trichonephila clavipes]